MTSEKIDHIVKWIKEYAERYNFDTLVVDIEYSMNNSRWERLFTYTADNANETGDQVFDIEFNYVRANVTAITDSVSPDADLRLRAGV